MKVKEYVDFAHFENDPHRQDVDLICIVGKPNGYVCADFITDCRRWKTAFRRFFNVLGSDPRFEGWDSTVYEAMLNGVWKDKENSRQLCLFQHYHPILRFSYLPLLPFHFLLYASAIL